MGYGNCFCAITVQRWEWHQPFNQHPRPSVVARCASENSRGQPLAPAFPPEYFADMAINHRKQLESMLRGRPERLPALGHAWRFVTELPSLDKSTFGEKLSDIVFQTTFAGDLAVYFKALLKNREGELIQFDGAWVALDEPSSIDRAMQRDCWHVQYALTQDQRELMVDMGLPGSGKKPDIVGKGEPVIGGKLALQQLRAIGTTTAVQVDNEGKPIAMRWAKVVTWPQLFLMGDMVDFTAQEIFTAGCLLERIMTVRERPKSSKLSSMAWLMANNGSDGQGVQWWHAGKRSDGRQGHWNDSKQGWSSEAWGASCFWEEKRWGHPS